MKWGRLPWFAAAALFLLAAAYWMYADKGHSPPEDIYASGFERVVFNISPDSSRVTVRGLSRDVLLYVQKDAGAGKVSSSPVLKVYALPGGETWDESNLPSTGSLSITGREITYRARHSWLPEVTYYARLDLPGIVTADTTFEIPAPSVRRPENVSAVYPSADTLPQNLLKFYIEFSGPMSRGGVYEHIRILDDNGNEVPDAFLELPQELWDPRATRLTILFDPGRIKRGLDRHNLMGVSFEPGRTYTLVVDSTLEDGNGQNLASSYWKTFHITGPDRSMPRFESWAVEAPASQTRDPLLLHFDEPLDHGLLRRVITVKRAGGEVAGTASTADEERTWRFQPDQPWQPGHYTVEIEAILEDLAGNNLKSVFDVDAEAGEGERQVNREVGEAVHIAFSIE